MREKTKLIYETIENYINNYFYSTNVLPSIQQIGEQIDRSKTQTYSYITGMVSLGILILDPVSNRYKTKKIAKLDTSICQVAVIGDIACGTPILAEQNIEDYVTLSSSLIGQGNFFALKAHGDSMINAGINDGDVVIVRQQNTAEEGQIVVALIDNEATLKRFYLDHERNLVRLHPENDELKDMFFPHIEIQGIVKKVLKDIE